MRASKWILLLAILTLLECGCLTSTVGAAPGKAPQIEGFYPTQVLRGETTEITVRGKHFATIQSVEITPSEGVSVGEIKEKEKGKAWTLVMVVGQEAQPGERSVVVVTPQGRLAAQTIRIPNHIPRITEIKVLSTKRAGGAVEFEATVFDEAGDLGPNPHMVVTILCGGPVYLSGTTGDKVTAKDSTNSVVHVSVSGYGISLPRMACKMEAGIQDQNRNQSKQVSTPVEFK